MTPTVAFVTISYERDSDRYASLCRVDLATRTPLLKTEDALPRGLRRCKPLSEAELTASLDGISPEETGVSVMANARMRRADYVEVIEWRWGRPPGVSSHTADSPRSRDCL